MTERDKDAMQHFANLARKGANAWASSGEKKAHAIAIMILENAGGLDANAIHGMAEFAKLVSDSYPLAKKLIQSEPTKGE